MLTYRTDPAKLRAMVPDPLEFDEREALVKYEFIRMPDSNGFGDYTESGQVIPVSFRGRRGSYTHCMFLNDERPIAGGRELWGFPKKLAQPTLRTEIDTLVGTLDYGPWVRWATSTAKRIWRKSRLRLRRQISCSRSYRTWTAGRVFVSLSNTASRTPKGAWTGPAALHLSAHALAPVAEFPVLEIVSAIHILAALTLGLGKVVHDYLWQPNRQAPRINEMALVS
jgi:acetoacetate decarboxylase